MKHTLEIELPTERDSVVLANAMASCIKAPLLLGFEGDIGAGKTTLIRAMLRALGVTSAIKSPTFAIMESYKLLDMDIHHFDLYRLQDEEELEYIGFRDFLTSRAVCCVEWPEYGGQYLATKDVLMKLSTKGAGRVMQLEAYTSSGIRFKDCLAGAYDEDNRS